MGKKIHTDSCIECSARMEEILKTFPKSSGKDSKKSKKGNSPAFCVIKKSKPAE